MNRKAEADTLDHPSPGFVAPAPPPFSSLVKADLAGLSHQGKIRLNNEDHYLVVRFGRSLQTLMTNLPEGLAPLQADEVGYAMIVADGMGGMAAGEVASRLAVSALVNLALNTPDWILRIGQQEAEEVVRRMVDRFRRVNAELIEQAEQSPALSGMGTTMSLAVSIGVDLFIFHVGDSRAYLLRRGRLHKLTRDHTVAQRLIDDGLISPQDEGARQLRHFLTQALGAKGDVIDPEVHKMLLVGGDQLLLCTDGLTEMVDEETIASILQEKGSAGEACRALIDLALEQGGEDNVTVVVARYDIPVQQSKG
jgi:protein phosphatase